MHAVPGLAHAPKLGPSHVELSACEDLGPSQVGSDDLVTELRVAHVALAAHCTEFVEFASLDLAGGSLADSDWYRTNWVDVRLSGIDAANAAFTESGGKRLVWQACRMTGFSAGGCTLADVTHDDCQLTMANFRFANLQRVRFTDCDLTGADFASCRLTDVVFDGCVLTDAQFSQARCERVAFTRCTLVGLRGIDGLRGASFAPTALPELAPLMAAALGIVLDD